MFLNKTRFIRCLPLSAVPVRFVLAAVPTRSSRFPGCRLESLESLSSLWEWKSCSSERFCRCLPCFGVICSYTVLDPLVIPRIPHLELFAALAIFPNLFYNICISTITTWLQNRDHTTPKLILKLVVTI